MAQDLDDTKFAGLRAAKDKMAGTIVKDLFAADPGRFGRYHVALDDLVFDYSKHRVDDTVLKALFDLAKAAEGLEGKPGRHVRRRQAINTDRKAGPPCIPRCATSTDTPVMVDGRRRDARCAWPCATR